MSQFSSRRNVRPRIERFEDRIVPSFGSIGGEVQINSFTTGDQGTSQIAMNAAGDYVIVWNSVNQLSATSDTDVFAQRFNSAGVAQGVEFQVNTFTTGKQAVLDIGNAVAMDAAGDFVIVWTSYTQDSGTIGVYGRRFQANGAPFGGEFQANTYTTDNQLFQSVAMDSAGDFVVTWSSLNQDGNIYGLYARRYNSSGVPLGVEFQVNTFTTGVHVFATVAMNAGGAFAITWASDQEGMGYEIYARRYDSAGAPLGGEFRVDTNTTFHQNTPTIGIDSAGEFAIAWESFGQDGSEYGVYAQRYDAAGTAQGPEFRVNTTTINRQWSPTLAMDAAGDFVIAWTSLNQDGSSYGIYAQRYRTSGMAQGGEFRVNSFTTGAQSSQAAAMDAAGDFVIPWTSLAQDGSGAGIFAQRYHADRPPTTSGLPNTTIPPSQSTNINLSSGFADADDGLAGLTFTMTGNTNAALFTSTTITGSTLTLTPDGVNGSAMLTVRATDPDGDFIETSFTVTVGPMAPAVSGTQVNAGAQQRSRVTSLTVTFSAQVTFGGTIANAFTLTRTGGGPVGFTATANLVGGATAVTLNAFTNAETENGSLRDGRYTLTVLANQVSAGGVNMTSNFTFGDPQGLFRFYGDMNGDRRVDISDFGFFSLAFLTPANYNAALDFNNDGRIDIADFGQFSVRYFTTLP